MGRSNTILSRPPSSPATGAHALLTTGREADGSHLVRRTALRLLSQLLLPTKRPSRSKPGQLVGTVPGHRLDMLCPTYSVVSRYKPMYPLSARAVTRGVGAALPSKITRVAIRAVSPPYVAWQSILSVANELCVASRISCSPPVQYRPGRDEAKFARAQGSNRCSSRFTADCSPTAQLPSHRSPSPSPRNSSRARAVSSELTCLTAAHSARPKCGRIRGVENRSGEDGSRAPVTSHHITVFFPTTTRLLKRLFARTRRSALQNIPVLRSSVCLARCLDFPDTARHPRCYFRGSGNAVPSHGQRRIDHDDRLPSRLIFSVDELTPR
ncbi:hypothetical protein LZ30DRAFT_290446 [Colletotrichum cereale]|nr:hypothetical protein LZ30DRAFT_290446 [Colletotrichum cereale]